MRGDNQSLWYCVRQRAGPLVKECRALRPRLSRYDSREDRRDKNEIVRSKHTAVCRTQVDRLELRLAEFGFRGSHYTMTCDDFHLPDRYDGMRTMFRAARTRMHRWHGGPFDWIGCIEGKHGDHRLHVHLVLRDEDFSPAEVRHLWTAGDVDDEPVLMREGGYRRLAKYFNKERPDGFVIPLGKHPWSCSRGLKAQIPEPERWRDDSGLIEVPDNVIWCRKGAHENDFGAYYYASYILPDGPQFGGRFFI